MHPFYDSTLNTWRLITEKLPDKPDFNKLKNDHVFKDYKFYTGYKNKDIQQQYDDEIAALKQNALTVQNPGLAGWEYKTIYQGKTERKTWTRQIDQCFEEVKPDELYFWPGGHTKKKVAVTRNGAAFYEYVAILTLPEEKKNTMENNYERELEIYLNEGINYGANTIKNADPEDLKQLASDSSHRGWTSSGSVAPPKPDLETENARLRQAYDYIVASRNSVDKELNEANAELAAAKESIKELLPIAERFTDWIYENCDQRDFDQHNDKVSRAKALLDKQ